MADLADGVAPGDRVKVIIQNKVPNPLFAAISGLTYCPAPFPEGLPPPGDGIDSIPTNVCANATNDKTQGSNGIVGPDADGRFEVTVTLPTEGDNRWPVESNRVFDLSCAPGDRCSIGFVYMYWTDETQPFQFFTNITSLSFTVKDPNQVEGCLPPAEFADVLGAFRLVRTEIRWAQERCAGGKPQDLELTALDEISARDTFRAGESDFFVAPGGVSEFDSGVEAGQRAAVPVPVALNAMVLAVSGKFLAPSITPGQRSKATVDDVSFTAEQLARVLVDPSADTRWVPQVVDANPQLAALGLIGRDTATVGAYATPEVGHLLTTRYLAGQAEGAWRYPSVHPVDLVGKPIGELWELDPLNPGSIFSLPQLVADRPGLGRMLDKGAGEAGFNNECLGGGGCLNFVLTDAATAAELRLPVVKLQNKGGNFVAPTAQSMAAATQEMTAQKDGTLLADVDTTNPNAYPLTFVEDTYAPAKRLMDASCQPTAKQKMINDVLGYLVGDGQDQLAEGYLPLPPVLWQTAAGQLGKVGADTAGCTAAAGGSGSGSTGAGSADLVGGPSSAGGVPGDGAAGTVPNAGSRPTQPVTRNGQQEAIAAAQQTRIPFFAGMVGPALLIPLGALVLLTALTSGTAFATSGRRLPVRVEASLAAVPRWGVRIRNLVLHPRRSVRVPGGNA